MGMVCKGLQSSVNMRRAGGQPSPSPSNLPTDNIRSVHSSSQSWLEEQAEQKPRSKHLLCRRLELTTSQLTILNTITTRPPRTHCTEQLIRNTVLLLGACVIRPKDRIRWNNI